MEQKYTNLIQNDANGFKESLALKKITSFDWKEKFTTYHNMIDVQEMTYSLQDRMKK